MFDTCKKQYWLTYYGSWGGWKWDCPPETRQTYILKQIQNRWMWAGTLVHDAIEHTLLGIRDGHQFDLKTIQEQTIQKMRQDFVSSRSRYYTQKPKTCALDEHHYALPEQNVDWVEVRDHVTNCLENFWNSSARKDAEALHPVDWLSVEEMDSFDLDGVMVWAIPDFAYRNKDGHVCIVDWKTGRYFGEPDPIQLACYALYGSQRWKCAPEDIITVEYNLSHGKGHTRKITQDILDEVRATIRASIQKMREGLVSVEDNIADQSAFLATEDKGKCRRCRYKEICFGAQWPNLFLEESSKN